MKKVFLLIATAFFGYGAWAQKISGEFPYESKFLEVKGSNMHYIEEYAEPGNPDQITFLFLHGNPTSNYLWRNIIPYVKEYGKAVAPDLIGMGKSDKPDIGYTFQDHASYLDAFIEQKQLKNIVLVIHDWGSALGFHYAHRNEEKVIGIVFMEAVTKPLTYKDDFSMMETMLFKRFRDDEKGHKMIAENNIFIDKMLFKMATKRKYSEKEKAYYSEPYPTVESRKAIRVWPQEVPIDGTPERNVKLIQAYSDWLKTTDLPKLLLYARPGMIIDKKAVTEIESNMKNIETVDVGKGLHFIQEDQPHAIGEAINEWYGTKFSNRITTR